MPTANSPTEIAAFIARRDPRFRAVIAQVGPPPRRRSARVDERFDALVRSITFQLLATRAADTIHRRVVDLCGPRVTADSILGVGAQALRAAGLSGTKAGAMIDLASRVRDGRVQLARHGRMSDDDVTADVTAVRGIGPWTAQMYLMHTLARADVWPVGDFGVRSGWTIVHQLDDMIPASELSSAAAKLEGVRSSVAWYCWQVVHLSRTAN